MTIYKKTFVAGNRTVAQVTIQFIVRSYRKFTRKIVEHRFNLDALQTLTLGIIKRLYELTI